MKILVILMGNARGGEDTWHSMYKHLLEPLNADLALCFGETQDHSSSLYTKAKFVWEIPEFSDWSEYYIKNCSGVWEENFTKCSSKGTAGGIKNYIGSGAIVFAFRHYIKNNYKDVMKEYDQIILTRSDYFYIADHPILESDYFWIVEGQDWGGISDRHHVFSSKDIDDVLGIVEFLDSYDSLNIIRDDNAETVLDKYYNFCGISKKIKRFKRTQFTVALSTDSTRWCKGTKKMPGNDNLLLKYIDEYEQTIENVR